ncbi:MAG: TlpA family protein disulfide reductase [Eubacterium sp.]|nr:TlpA family protein disulfide reductase [Eubacterium sp.]MBQ9022539.1 TlpA family protein disulfide reductase [Eubacterium sp.]
MKKIIGMILALTMVISLSACAGNPQENTAGNGAEEVVDVSDVSDDSANTGTISKMPEFTTIDLDQNKVDDSIFAQADITVVNVWGTFCPPCIAELPELAEWSEELPDNVQIIGLLADVRTPEAPEYETALELVEQNHVTYTNILVTSQFDEMFRQLVGVPTTFFVDSQGNILREAIIGADVEGYKKAVEELL